MLLSDLYNGDAGKALPLVDIQGLAADSREVRPGYLFAALTGSEVDGRDFIPDALGHGAVAVLAPPGTSLDQARIPLVPDDNPRRRLALMAARFFQKQPETAVAVTGTNGKTSVAVFVEQLWQGMGLRAASVGTLGIHSVGYKAELAHTTPDPVTLHRMLADLSNLGVDNVAMEASSHGLDQHRLDGVRLKAAAFTNLSHDHLDYHSGEDAYLSAKARLFTELLPAGAGAVLNADSMAYPTLGEICLGRGHQMITFGKLATDIRIKRRRPNGEGQTLDIQVMGRDYSVQFPVIGDFQAQNAACALGLVIACGADPEQAVEALNGLSGVKGRIEKVAEHPNGAPVFIDYAHTPDALETLLRALKPHASNRLVVVFGCGGDRDQAKRPAMGSIACAYADHVIVTDDNPRNENAAAIRRSVMAGCDRAIEIRDRGEAIRAAVAGLNEGDALVVAGKGHEQGQIIRDEVRLFDDAEVARAAVAELGGYHL